jgi:hypothetical protein
MADEPVHRRAVPHDDRAHRTAQHRQPAADQGQLDDQPPAPRNRLAPGQPPRAELQLAAEQRRAHDDPDQPVEQQQRRPDAMLAALPNLLSGARARD